MKFSSVTGNFQFPSCTLSILLMHTSEDHHRVIHRVISPTSFSEPHEEPTFPFPRNPLERKLETGKKKKTFRRKKEKRKRTETETETESARERRRRTCKTRGKDGNMPRRRGGGGGARRGRGSGGGFFSSPAKQSKQTLRFEEGDPKKKQKKKNTDVTRQRFVSSLLFSTSTTRAWPNGGRTFEMT